MQMKPKLFPKNFIKIQTPPTLTIKERKDGALVIDPPTIGGGGQTITNTDTAVGSITKSGTDTYSGTSTDTGTSTSTSGAVALSRKDMNFAITGARIDSARPKQYYPDTKLNDESFDIVKPIPKGDLSGEENIELTGEPTLRDFLFDNLSRPELDDAKPRFILPDLGHPWEGVIAESSDSDDDSDGDQDDVPDGDNDNDSDDEPDRDDDHDFVDMAGYEAIKKHVLIKPPLAAKGTKGWLGRQ
jgi:hypothetical protein